MFSSKLLPSSICIVQYLKCSPLHRVSLTQQICCVRTDERGRFVERNSLVERKSRSKKKTVKKELPPIVKKNPGIGHTLAVVAEETGTNYFDPRLYDENKEEEVEEFYSERNFFDVHEDYDEIKREEFAHKKKLAYLVTKQKFFKPPVEPNLLTYAEKEHIRFLYNDEHQNWTVESLAESYPASLGVIKKIVKGKWKAKSAVEIRKHDERVRRNWEAFKKGELLIHSEDVKQHLKQFSDRDIKVPSLEDANKFITKPEKKCKKIDEFSRIIENYKMLHPPSNSEAPSLIGRSIFEAEPRKIKKSEMDKNRSNQGETGKTEMKDKYKSAFSAEKEFQKEESKSYSAHVKPESEEPRLIQENDRTSLRSKHFTLDKLRDSMEKMLKWKEDINSVDKQIINSRRKKEFEILADFDNSENEKQSLLCDSDENTATKESDREEPKESRSEKAKESKAELSFVKRVDNQLVMKTFSQDLAEELKVAEYVKIPKHLRKDGALYKVKDCFYADDGQFLFRVPGLKS